jgi:hypothetical protein
LGLELLDGSGKEHGELRRLTVDDLSYEDDGWIGCSDRGEDRSEVGVGGDDDPSVYSREFDDLRVGRSGCVEVADVCGIVAGVNEQDFEPRR